MLKGLFPQSVRNYIHSLQSSWANLRFGYPAKQLKIIGVTGTDGKTTTSTMIYHILKESGKKVGLITSVSAKIGKKEIDTGLHVTTPDPWVIPKILRAMVREGVKWVVMEVTSHALDQNRVANITFEKGVFTNITKEHLDYHKTWKGLALAKTKLIDMVKEGGEIVFKEDEPGGKFIAKRIKISKTVHIPIVCNDEMAINPEATREGLRFGYMISGKEVEIEIPILGKYNIANAQCAIKACETVLEDCSDIVKALKTFKGVTGRMQIVRKKKPCLVIVDFAHTSNALKQALKTVKSLKGKGRVIVVFGCAAKRDKYKRPKMGEIAAKYAKVVILTAEDPREEGLAKINDMILEGALKRGKLIKRFPNRKSFRKSKIEKFIDLLDSRRKKKNASVFTFDQDKPNSREDAIEFAIKIAEPNDIIIMTGKGHEKSLCFGTKEYLWSDFEAVKRAVKVRYGK